MSGGRSSRYGSADLPPKPPHEVVVDLHLHTTASDGALSPTQLIDLVAGTSLRVISITDHDTTDGIDEAQAAVSKLPNLTLIPGIELGTQDGPSEVHLLGYFINHRDAGLRAALLRFREERVVAARLNVDKLRSMGVKITWERVRELAGGTVGRPHIAKAMVEGGYVASVRDAFDKYLGDNGIGRVSRPKLDPVDALGIIHDAGGVGAIAHPRTVKQLGRVTARLADAGLAGIEVYAEKYGPDEQAGYRSVARQNGLVECGGSDYHAFGYPNEVTPGLYGPPPDTADLLFERAQTMHGNKAFRVPSRPI